jgi:hypothetical protein
MTRQFITEPSDDNGEGIWQLSLSICFPPDNHSSPASNGRTSVGSPAELVRRADRLLQADACRAADLVAVDGDPARQEWIELNTESNV